MPKKTKPILVLGATGKTGSRLVPLLRDRGVPVRAASRGGEVRFDWDDETTWGRALTGVGAVYLVDQQDKPGQWDAETMIERFYARAADLGVTRVVALQARPAGAIGGKDLHAGTDTAERSGLEWTVLRPSWFNQNFDEGVLLDGVRAGELPLPAGDGAEAFVDVADVAAVAAVALTEDGHHGRVYNLSGPAALTFAEAVEVIGHAAGREVRYVPVSQRDYEAELVGAGVPADYATFVGDLVARIDQGTSSAVTFTVEQVTGRAPVAFADFAKEAASRGVWAAA
ncbi:NAD(P)H-binding protein [Actinosynnema pretiosum]|uniref:NAD(P)-dependent oxidoreductase n=1 Tax=Actinosynnema pretiosum TaxID=42197 RepID=A0A290Z9Z9_9PSEU|nr:NAD(P)H-binding protein [Actinosynnema pretiosum]ATE55861.1 NAD(P)-dependent oxidoreductase [Actinosynnema pretiosum]